MKAIKIK